MRFWVARRQEELRHSDGGIR